MPSLGSLDLYLDTDVLELEQIPRVFPSLERVVIVSPRHVDRIDISPIRAMPNCEVSAGPAAVAGDDPLH